MSSVEFLPIIAAEVKKVSGSRKTGWRCLVLVDDAPMCMSHHPTKRLAIEAGGKMVKVYMDINYKKGRNR